MEFSGLMDFELWRISCVFCGRVLGDGKGVVRIVEYSDRNCVEELRYWFAHLDCFVHAVQVVGGGNECTS